VARILVVDDEPHIRKLVAFSLQRRDHEVFEAEDGPRGIALAQKEHPDLILMDVMMPMMTGLQALELLKADPATSDIPVAMLSAKSQEYEQTEGLSRGAVKYVCKPFKPSELGDMVAEILANS